MKSMVSIIRTCLCDFSGCFNRFKFLNQLNSENISSPKSKYFLKTIIEWFLSVG